MHIRKLFINGFRRLMEFDLELGSTCNTIVGDNETGKSSILEALALVLTGQHDGRSIFLALDPYLFNAGAVSEYFNTLRRGNDAAPPEILIEAYFQDASDDDELARLKGRNNTKGEDCPGLELKIFVHRDHVEALKDYARDESNPSILPVEFYCATWRNFAGSGVTLRNLPFRAKIIDNTLPRAYRGPNKYVAQLANEVLTEAQRRDLALAYRKMRHEFSRQKGVEDINNHVIE